MQINDKRKFLNGLKVNKFLPRSLQQRNLKFSQGPESFDWRDYIPMTPVRDQGYKCNSCWAFTSVDALSAQLYRSVGRLLRFSEQNLIDCAYNNLTGNWGCDVSFKNFLNI